jgi:hypothetical protein
MKYKVGDKVIVRSDLKKSVLYGGLCVVAEMIKKKIVTIASVHDGYYKVVEDDYEWTDEMFEGLVDDELTAEEVIKVLADMCARGCKNCELGKPVKESMYSSCSAYRREHPDEVIEILKQYKKDHEKKEIEVVKKTCCLVIDEKRTVVHEEEIDNHDSCEEVLKRYCEEHDGKFFAICESRYAVKE